MCLKHLTIRETDERKIRPDNLRFEILWLRFWKLRCCFFALWLQWRFRVAVKDEKGLACCFRFLWRREWRLSFRIRHLRCLCLRLFVFLPCWLFWRCFFRKKLYTEKTQKTRENLFDISFSMAWQKFCLKSIFLIKNWKNLKKRLAFHGKLWYNNTRCVIESDTQDSGSPLRSSAWMPKY